MTDPITVSPDVKYIVDHLPIVIVGSLIMYFQWRNSQKVDHGNKTNDVIISKVEAVDSKVNGQASLLAANKVVDDAAAKAAAVLASGTTVAAVLDATKSHDEAIRAKQAEIDDLRRQLAEVVASKP